MESLPVINKTYEIYKAVIELNCHLDKRWRYSIGQSLENSIMSLLQEEIMAKNAPRSLKSGYLIKASSHQEIISLKLRLYMGFELVNQTKIFQMQSRIAEIGRMIGGWLKSLS
jgi:hypothetical protein